jgi:hypothetical protein
MSFLCTTSGRMDTKGSRLMSLITSWPLVNAFSGSNHPSEHCLNSLTLVCCSYITILFMQYGGLLSVRNRRVSILNSNPLWGPRRNLIVPAGMIGTALIGVVNIYGSGLQRVFSTTPIPGMYWGLPFAFATGILIMDELRKLIVRSYPKVSRTYFILLIPISQDYSLSSRRWHGNISVFPVRGHFLLSSPCPLSLL